MRGPRGRGGPWRFVDDLIHQRRPRPFRARPGDEEQVRMGILLGSARPGAGAVRPEFVEQLHRRLAAAGLETGAATAGPGAEAQGTAEAQSTAEAAAGARAGGSGGPFRPEGPARSTRRRVVQVTSLAAGSAAVGAGLDRVLAGRPGGPAATADEAPPVDQTAVLTPNSGVWRTVATSRDLPVGGVHPFDAGTVSGFVERGADGRVRGVTGTCTHQGCRLVLDPAVARLNCPCHRTVFAVTGEVVRSQLRPQPRRLPELRVREIDGLVQVFVPPNSV
ncbi:ubiquinol-cytochrome c reductase iron-sulfur subunit [Pseudofrankia inefficax]|uniref:Rieske (2Fe-2S) iron-sulfur domain protein n=1 Tax=Pseudofrankia inefficax (strain DSM 45817 / CECT 9037 / DDB 130130 / EuI1c) TaxID=298654 RepID=E3J581_PSEI1|nr:Rieske (2Fe-2S) protein [Pseudofrankia inefficax]ADP80679.1 Rieske (2Fe-2S) iron-sulfur domain protein [Pseudofrankia inefficax]